MLRRWRYGFPVDNSSRRVYSASGDAGNFNITALFVHLWNITVPGIFQLREIEFWEGFRLLLLSCILFGGCAIPLR